jgi:hypothetical protein
LKDELFNLSLSPTVVVIWCWNQPERNNNTLPISFLDEEDRELPRLQIEGSLNVLNEISFEYAIFGTISSIHATAETSLIQIEPMARADDIDVPYNQY